MRHNLLTLSCCLTLVSNFASAQSFDQPNFNPSTVLWYQEPAQKWEEALPVGNGRLGAMVFGKPSEERIQLNEETYWKGGPYSTVVKGGHEVLPEIQKYVFEGKMLKAHNLFGRRTMGYPVEQQKYQSLANLHLFFAETEPTTVYKRWLDLETGITSVEYRVQEVRYRRDVFVSAPNQVVVLRLTASEAQKISFKANLRGVRNPAHSNYGTDYFTMDPYGQDGLMLKGKSSDYLGVEGKLRFEGQVKVVAEGGTVRTDDVDLWVEKADAVTLYFNAATNFVNYHDVSADPHARVEAVWKNMAGKSYTQIRDAAVKDHQKYFQRTTLQLEIAASSYLPTNERMLNIQKTADPSLAALVLQLWPLFVDWVFPAWHPARQPARHLEQRHEPRLGFQIHYQHQHRDELLACGNGQLVGMCGAPHPDGQRIDGSRQPGGQRTLRLPRLGVSPKH
nr:glycoside hydrolase family 95 protein [Haliscomenobacter sp.]